MIARTNLARIVPIPIELGMFCATFWLDLEQKRPKKREKIGF